MEWISVKDQLPETTETVLTLCVDSDIHRIARYIHGCWLIASPEDSPITHWTPLPEPPKTEPKHWVYKTHNYGPYYLIYDQNGDSVSPNELCIALNGTAQELLEFAGMKCKCRYDDHGPFYCQRSEYKTADGGYWVYQIVDRYNNSIGGRHVIDMLNDRCYKCQGDETERGSEKGRE